LALDALDPKVHEDVVTIELSKLLYDHGLINRALSLMGSIPDIYMVIGGIRVILEVKEEGEERALEIQLKKRLNENLCDLAVGIIYPSRVVEGALVPPTPKEVRERLLNEKLSVFAFAPSINDLKTLLKGSKYNVSQLPGLLIRIAHEAIPDEEVNEATDKIKEVILKFSNQLSTLREDRVRSIAEKIREVLEAVE